MFLFQAGEGQLLSTDEDTFIHLLGMRSVGHLRAMFDEYKVLSTKDIMEAIDGETSGDFQNTLHAIGKAIFCEIIKRTLQQLLKITFFHCIPYFKLDCL